MENRVQFDFKIEFTNGGGIQGQGFRLDIEGNDISDRELADYIVDDMRLLMVGTAKILNKQIISEPHKRKPINTKDSESSLIDLSHTITDGLVTYKGLPPPVVCDYWSREKSEELYGAGITFHIAEIKMVANTGTYIDVPFHRYETGNDLSQVELESFVDIDGIVIRADYKLNKAINSSFFKDKEIRGRAVLVHTGWDKHWNTDQYVEDSPFITKDAAEYLRDCGVKLVGIDSVNIDDMSDKSRPAHSILLADDILIVEHMCNLHKLPNEGFKFSAIPPKFAGVGTFPVRAFAKLKTQ